MKEGHDYTVECLLKKVADNNIKDKDEVGLYSDYKSNGDLRLSARFCYHLSHTSIGMDVNSIVYSTVLHCTSNSRCFYKGLCNAM